MPRNLTDGLYTSGTPSMVSAGINESGLWNRIKSVFLGLIVRPASSARCTVAEMSHAASRSKMVFDLPLTRQLPSSAKTIVIDPDLEFSFTTSPSNTRFQIRGDSTPPCGVPATSLLRIV